MCVKQPRVNRRFLNKKRKKKKDLIDRYKNDSQSPKISMNGKHKGGRTWNFFSQDRVAHPLISLFMILLSCAYWLYVPPFIMLFY